MSRTRKNNKQDIIFPECLAGLITGIIKTIGLPTDSECNRVTWWANIAAVVFVVCCSLQTVALVTAKDSGRLFECFSVLSFCSMGMLKLFSLRVYRTRWLHLLAQMRILENKHVHHKETPEEEYDSDEDFLDLTTFVHDYTEQFRSTSTLLLRVYSSTLIGFTLSPFIEYVFQKITEDGSLEYPHILPCWAPFEQKHVVGYMISIFMEVVASIYCVAVHLAFDRSSAGVMIFVKGQFFLLRRYCENIAGKGRRCNVTKKRDRRALYRIKYSHQTLLILFSIVKELEKLLKNVMGIYYFDVTLTLCTVAMRFKTEVLGPTEIFSLVQYLGGTLTQLFLFCYYGSGVCEASTMSLGQGPSGSAYWCISPRVRRHLALLTISMARPRRLRVGPFHFLVLPSFAMIVRAAYSYYAFLGK